MAVHALLCNALGCLLWGANPQPPVFAEIWYKEVFEGAVATAAGDYEALYLKQPSDKLSPLLQQKAAFRAGRCFEQLGLTQSAIPAYLASSRSPGSSSSLLAGDTSLAAESVLRLRSMGAYGAISPFSEEVEVELTVQAGAEVLRSAERSRFALIAGLEGAIQERMKSREIRQQLLRRLGAQGASLSFSAEQGPSSQASLVGELGDLLGPDPELEKTVISALRDRALLRALEALEGHDYSLALRERKTWLALGGAGSAAADPCARLLSDLDLGAAASASAVVLSRLSAAATRRLIDFRLERKARVLAELNSLLDEAAAQEARNHRELACAPLDKVRQLLDWAPEYPREDPDLRALRDSVLLRLRVFARSSELEASVVRLWSTLRDEADRVFLLSEGFVEEALEELQLRGPAQAMPGAHSDDVCRAELESLLVVARTGMSSVADQRSLDAATTRALTQAAILAEWRPSLVSTAARAVLDAAPQSQNSKSEPRGSRKPEVKAK